MLSLPLHLIVVSLLILIALVGVVRALALAT